MSLLPHWLVLFFASGSEARVEPEWSQSEGRANPERTQSEPRVEAEWRQSEGRVEAWCVEWCDKMWCDILGRLRSCLNLIDEFYYGHGRAVFSSFRLRSVSQSERKRRLCLLLSQRNVSEANGVPL